MNRYKAHQELVKNAKLHCQKKFPKIRFFDRHVGLLYTKYGTPIKINKKGMADLWGIYNFNGNLLHLEFEAKTGKATQTKEQKNWQHFIESMEGNYFLFHSPEELEEQIRGFINGLSKDS